MAIWGIPATVIIPPASAEYKMPRLINTDNFFIIKSVFLFWGNKLLIWSMIVIPMGIQMAMVAASSTNAESNATMTRKLSNIPDTVLIFIFDKNAKASLLPKPCLSTAKPNDKTPIKKNSILCPYKALTSAMLIKPLNGTTIKGNREVKPQGIGFVTHQAIIQIYNAKMSFASGVSALFGMMQNSKNNTGPDSILNNCLNETFINFWKSPNFYKHYALEYITEIKICQYDN